MGNDIIQAQVTRRIVLAAPVMVGNPEDRTLRLCVSDESRDRYKSIIRCDGWKTDNYAKNPVVLFAHDSAQPPVGSGKAFSTTSEMRPYTLQHPKRAMDASKMGKFSRWHADTQFAKRETYPFADIIYKLFLDKHLRATSVGFNPIDSKQLNHDDQLGEDWARDLTELQIGDVVHRAQELLEYSAVPIPGNQNAVVESLKLWVPGLRSAETKTAECVRSFLATPAITDDGFINAAELDTESEFSKTCREFQGLLLLTRELMAAEPQSETKVTSGWTKEIEAVAKRLEQGGGKDSEDDPGHDLTHEPEGKDAGWNHGGVSHEVAKAGAKKSEHAALKHDSHADWHDAQSEKHKKAAHDASAQGETDGSTAKDDFGRAAEQHAEAADQHTALSSAHKAHADLLRRYADAKAAGDDLRADRLGRSVRNSKNDIDDKNQRLRGFYKRTKIEKPGKDEGGVDAQKAWGADSVGYDAEAAACALSLENETAVDLTVEEAGTDPVESRFHAIKKVGKKFCVIAKKTGKKLGCHDTKEDAQAQLGAIEASMHGTSKAGEVQHIRYNENHDPSNGQFSSGTGGGSAEYHNAKANFHSGVASSYMNKAKSSIAMGKSAKGAADKQRHFEDAKESLAQANEHTAIAEHHASEHQKLTAGKKSGTPLETRAPAPSSPPTAQGQDPESQPDPSADQDQMDHEQGEITDREELRETLQEAVADIDDATGRIQEALGMLDDADADDADQMSKIRPEDAEPPNLAGPKGKPGKDDQPGPRYAVSYFDIAKRFDEHHSSGGDFISGDHRDAAYSALSASGHHRHHGGFHDTMALKHGDEADKGKAHAKAADLHHGLARAYDQHANLHHAAADLKAKLEAEKQGKAIGPNAVQPVGNMEGEAGAQRAEPVADAKRLGEMLSKSGRGIIAKRNTLHDHLKAMGDAGHYANPSDCRSFILRSATKERVIQQPSTRLIEKIVTAAFEKASTELRNQLVPCLNGLAKRSELSTFMVDLDEVKRSLRELSARSVPARQPIPAPAPKAPASGGEHKEPDRKAAAEHHERILRETRSQAAQLLSRMDALVAASKPIESAPRAPKFPHREGKPEAQK